METHRQAACFTRAVLRTSTCFGLMVVSASCLRRRIDAGGAARAARASDLAGDEQGYMSAVNEAKSQIGAQ